MTPEILRAAADELRQNLRYINIDRYDSVESWERVVDGVVNALTAVRSEAALDMLTRRAQEDGEYGFTGAEYYGLGHSAFASDDPE